MSQKYLLNSKGDYFYTSRIKMTIDNFKYLSIFHAMFRKRKFLSIKLSLCAESSPFHFSFFPTTFLLMVDLTRKLMFCTKLNEGCQKRFYKEKKFYKELFPHKSRLRLSGKVQMSGVDCIKQKIILCPALKIFMTDFAEY